MFGFVILIMCTSTITVYLMWQKTLPRTNDEMEFLKFGSLTKDESKSVLPSLLLTFIMYFDLKLF